MKNHSLESLETSSQSPLVESSFLQKTSNRLALLFLLILIPLVLFVWQQYGQKERMQQMPQTWEIELAYTIENKQLVLSKIVPLQQKIVRDYRDAALGPYVLVMQDAAGTTLYSTPIKINDMPSLVKEDAIKPYTTVRASLVYVPYKEHVAKIIILRRTESILEIMLPKQ